MKFQKIEKFEKLKNVKQKCQKRFAYHEYIIRHHERFFCHIDSIQKFVHKIDDNFELNDNDESKMINMIATKRKILLKI